MTQKGAQEIIDNDSPLNRVTCWSGVGKIASSVVGQINGCVLAMCLAEVTPENKRRSTCTISTQNRATIGPSAKRHLNGVSLAGR